MNFILEIINALSFIFIILAFCGVPFLLSGVVVIRKGSMGDDGYKMWVVLVLFLILITLLAIAGMIITY